MRYLLPHFFSFSFTFLLMQGKMENKQLSLSLAPLPPPPLLKTSVWLLFLSLHAEKWKCVLSAPSPDWEEGWFLWESFLLDSPAAWSSCCLRGVSCRGTWGTDCVPQETRQAELTLTHLSQDWRQPRVGSEPGSSSGISQTSARCFPSPLQVGWYCVFKDLKCLASQREQEHPDKPELVLWLVLFSN